MRTLALAAALAASLAAGLASGHAMPNSTVVIASTFRGVEASVSIPLSELNAALGHAASPEGSRAELESYIRAHVAVAAADGRPWPTIRRMTAEGGEHPALILQLAFARPSAAGPASLLYDAVNHRIASHYVLIYRKGPFGGLRPLGRLQYPDAVLALGAAR
jgi:hypothetical protein